MGSLHARVISQEPRAELALIVDPHEASAARLADRFETAHGPLLDDVAAFDALVVASPTSTHLDLTLRALEASIPVLVEKPITEDLVGVERIVDEARSRGVPLMCGLLERFNPAVMTMLDIVQEPVHITTVRHSPFVPRIATGVAFDLLIHDVDLVLSMTDSPVIDVKGHFGYPHPKSLPGSEDVAEASIAFEGGLVAAMSASRVSQRKIRTLEVAELERMVEVDLVRQDVTVYRHVGADFLEGRGAGFRQQTVIDIPVIPYGREPLAGQLDHFLRLIAGEIDPEQELDTLVEPHRLVARVVELGQRTV